MIEQRVDLGSRSYPIQIGELEEWDIRNVLDWDAVGAITLVADAKVWNLWGTQLRVTLGASGIEVDPFLVEPSEAKKGPAAVFEIYDHLLERRVRRDGCLFVFGGGVLGDVGGFAAATYQRGIRFIQIPSTLLSMVDSAVGGKTGVNYGGHKNMIGAFHQPSAVFISPGWLATLPPREVSAGLAEVIKCGVIRDPKLLDLLEKTESDRLVSAGKIEEIIASALTVKAAVVAEDERDNGVRQHLNFGHTLGHAIESVTGFGRYLHGEAVAVGMIAALHLSVELEGLDRSVLSRVEELLLRYSLPIRVKGVDSETLIGAMGMDKKAGKAGQAWVLTPGLGEANVTSRVSSQALRGAISYIVEV